MEIFIRNMVCVRCTMAVRSALDILNIPHSNIILGKATVDHELSCKQFYDLSLALSSVDLEILMDRKDILINNIKMAVREMISLPDDSSPLKLSVYLSEKLGYSYTYLANIYSGASGVTIEKFYIINRIEKVKELIVYEKLKVTEIARLMNYSSSAHLCLQFKKVTGISPSAFKKMLTSGEYQWKDDLSAM